jgi:DNA-binding FrmR family transcriptional regulator
MSESATRGYGNEGDALVHRLRGSEGQAQGIERVADDRHRTDIPPLLVAVDAARHRVAGAFASGGQVELDTRTSELLAPALGFAKSR